VTALTKALGSAVLVLPLLALPSSASTAGHCAPAKHVGGEWRSYGHDSSNTRSQPAEKTIGRVEAALLAPAWTFSASAAGGSGDFTGTPTIADGCLYIASNDGWVFAANADTGEKVWATHLKEGGINSSVTAQDGQLYVAVSRVGTPYVAALDQKSGRVLWTTTIDKQPGSDVYGSPVIVDGVLLEGVSGGSAELGGEADRYAFQGSMNLVETGTSPRSTTRAGQVLRKTWTIQAPTAKPKNDFAGAGIWSTPAVDPAARVAYVGAGNPFRPQADHAHADAVLKFDIDRASPRFGQVVASYKGIVDEYFPQFSQLPCFDIPGNPAPYYPQGLGQCGDLDLDFGASPNLFTLPGGRKVVGAGQKSGVYHVMDAATMKPVWTQLVGPPSAVGGIVGSTAVAGGAVFGPITVGGYLWSVDQAAGAHRWVAPVGDGAHWGNPVSTANGVVYTVDFRGFLDAYDAATGVSLLHRSLLIGGPLAPTLSWGGVSIARGTIYAAVGMSGLPDGQVVALRPLAGGGAVPAPAPSGGPAPTGGPEDQAVPHIVAGPQAQFAGYLTPTMVASKSAGRVLYTNLDVVRHDVVQDPRTDGVAGKGKDPWCTRFAKGKCPVFWAPLLGLGETAELRGLKNTVAGRTYTFYCSLHPGMRGTLAVVD
jgi:polyvinyl alcohol dehydrogenase (cytochrome)